MRRLREFEVRPSRELGQNFLIDSNILGVIGRAAALGEQDVVLEIGGGLGVLSEWLAERVAHVHVVEIDRRLEAALDDAVGRLANVSVVWGDAMEVDLAALAPAPTATVANLPYGVAAGALLRVLEELPSVQRCVVMVQREVGERLAAAPGSGVYGATSVLAQLCGEVRVVRAIPRSVFFPVPNVDSVLVSVVRTGPAPEPGLRALVAGAFAHRRKALARSLVLADAQGEARSGGRRPALDVPIDRDRVRAALVELGHPADARAETLAPEEFRGLWRALGVEA